MASIATIADSGKTLKHYDDLALAKAALVYPNALTNLERELAERLLARATSRFDSRGDELASIQIKAHETNACDFSALRAQDAINRLFDTTNPQGAN